MEIPTELIGVVVLLLLQIIGAVYAYGKLSQRQRHQGDTLDSLASQHKTMNDMMIGMSEHVKGINGHIHEQATILTAACSDIGNLKTVAAINGTKITNIEHRLGATRTRATDVQE